MKSTIATFVLALFLITVVLPSLIVRGCDLTDGRRLPPREEAVTIRVFLHENGEVVTMGLEEYIKGVVAAEMPASFHEEALKAQAVVARTYAVGRMRVFGGRGCSRHPEADVCTDHTHCQAWMSAEAQKAKWGIINYYRWADKVSSAVEATWGLIILYQHEIIDPVYHSTCGGHTEDSELVWQAALPYLRGVPCPYDTHSPHMKSTVSLPLSEVLQRMNAVSGRTPAVEVLSRSATGRVLSARVGTATYKGTEVRAALGLKSTRFEVTQSADVLTFNATGYGHGVGLCQYGADGMARTGKSFRDIITYYYQGVRVVPLFGE